MADFRFDQNSFTHGEADPRMYARSDWENYYKSAKFIRNLLVIPQGGAQRRWGTKFVDICRYVNPAMPLYCEINTLLIDDISTYLLVWEALSLTIYLENVIVATFNVAGGNPTIYAQEDIPLLRFTQVQDRLIVVNQNFPPYQLVRSPDAAQAITAFDDVTNTLTFPNAANYAVGTVLPVTFGTGGVLPTTNPQIYVNRPYFIKIFPGNTFQIYTNSYDAINGIDFYLIMNAGALATVTIINTWNFVNILTPGIIINYPTYDFNGGYFGAGFTFTPSATTGTVVITASAPIFTAAMVMGTYSGNGGIVRITVFTDTTHVTGYTIQPFPNTNPIPGVLSYLTEPAWSAARGYPRVAAYFQERLVFANTPLLPNGIWLSTINQVYNFDDSETLADNAISWYPGGGSMSFIRSLTSTRSLIVHSTTGTYSTPVSTEIAITPTNFVLIEHNKYGVFDIQPVFIDNQIFFLDASGTNVINMLWEFSQSAYVTNNISVNSTILIKRPQDMASFAQPEFTDGFYSLFINEDGTMAVVQTLHEQNVVAWSLQTESDNNVTDQFNTLAPVPCSYVRVTTGRDRCWFTVQHSIPIANAPVAITNAPGNNELTAIAHGMPIGVSTLVTFTTLGALPLTIPPLNTTQFWFAEAIDADTFILFTTAAAANAVNNPDNIGEVVVIDAGVNSFVTSWTPTLQLYVEEVDFSVYTDCSITQVFPLTTNFVGGLDFLNGQVVQIVADGYVLPPQTVINDGVPLPGLYTTVTVGLQYISQLTPLPIALPTVPGTLYRSKHIRKIYVQYYNTLGASIQGFIFPATQLQNIILNEVPAPQSGVSEYTLQEGWDGFAFDIDILQSLPLPMTILGLSYISEIS